MTATVNSFILQQNLPDAQLILDPDSGHGAHFQYPESFAIQARLFFSTASQIRPFIPQEKS